MRHFGTKAYGIRAPIINRGDDLVRIITDSLAGAVRDGGIKLLPSDILGVTEAVVAKAMGNFASTSDIAADVSAKFGGGSVGVVFPILSRNRFLNILKGISEGAEKVCVLLSYPSDEMGNPIMDERAAFDAGEKLRGLIPAREFAEIAGRYTHPFTSVNYIALYEEAADNIEVYFSNNPADILRLTKNVIAADIHSRKKTKRRLERAGAEIVCTLADILAKPVNGSGYNEKYGVLGANMATESTVKLFPRDCDAFIKKLRESVRRDTGVEIEMLVFGDGAFKDPACGIWELADPVVCPAYTGRLSGHPAEVKIKFAAESVPSDLRGKEKDDAVKELVKKKSEKYSQGTTPRKYADLAGSLCDLVSGSGDKGTPLVLLQGFFDNYADE